MTDRRRDRAPRACMVIVWLNLTLKERASGKDIWKRTNLDVRGALRDHGRSGLVHGRERCGAGAVEPRRRAAGGEFGARSVVETETATA